MKTFFHSRDGASKGAALMIVLALVVLLAGLALAYFSRTTTDRQLAQSSYNDTSADLLSRSALDIVVNDFKQEILNAGTITRSNIQPQRSGDDQSIPNLIRRSVRSDPIPAPGVSSFASAISSTPDPANPKRGDITSARWNSHYLVPRLNPSNTAIDSTPVSTFAAPDWVLVTRSGPVAFSAWQNSLKDTTSNNYVVGRYAFAVYNEGGLLDMNVAGYPSWSGNPGSGCNPSPTPWLLNVGRKGIVGMADLSALGTYAPPQSQIDRIIGWRNYATTNRTFNNFPSGDPGFSETNCANQNNYGSYLLYFGDPPFTIDSLADKMAASIYPFTSVASETDPSNSRTDQRLMTRQQLIRLQRSICTAAGSYDDSKFSQNVLQYMGTFSRERNWPAPDWPGLNGSLSAGRYNFNNLAIIIPNPADCFIAHGRKVGWQTGKNKNHLCGNSRDVNTLFGLFWVKSEVVAPCPRGVTCPGYWTYIGNVSSLPDPNATPSPTPGIGCLRGANRQSDFFQILNFALFGNQCGPGPDQNVDKVFAIGASLIDQYDSAAYDSGSGSGCPTSGSNNNTQPPGCDLDAHAVGSNWNKRQYATHTTVIKYGRGNGSAVWGYGMEPDFSVDSVNGDKPYDPNFSGNDSHRPQNAPAPVGTTQVISHSFSTVGEFGYGVDTSPSGVTAGLPTLRFWDPSPPAPPTSTPYPYAPLLDFFSYNPISSAYPRAGIVSLYTKNKEVIAAILSKTLKTDAAANSNPPSPVVGNTASELTNAAAAVRDESQRVLAGTASNLGRTDLTRAIAGRLANAAFSAVPSLATSDETKGAVVRALAEMGQTRTWNLLIDVIAQTGHYSPNAQGLTDFIPEGEKRYWLHIALGRDLIQADGNPCGTTPTAPCQVDVLGSQLEEVTE